MFDKLDQHIRRAAKALHETARQQSTALRRRKRHQSEARVLIDEINDRVLFHFPLTKRKQRPDLSDKQFLQLHQAESAHRTQLLMSIVTTMGLDSDGEDASGTPVNEFGQRLDF